MYAIGRNLTTTNGEITCFMGNTTNERSDGDAVLQGVKETMQFLLEKVDIVKEEIQLILCCNKIVHWIREKKTLIGSINS